VADAWFGREVYLKMKEAQLRDIPTSNELGCQPTESLDQLYKQERTILYK